MTSDEKNQYIKSKNKLYIFIWLFLLFELAAFFIIFFFYVVEVPKKTLKSGNDFNTIFLYLSYISVIVAVPLSYKIYDIKRKQAEKKTNLHQKTEIYFFTVLINFSVLELAALLTLAAFFINKMYEPLYMYGIIFVAVLLNKPSLNRFLQEKPSSETDEHVILPKEEEKKLEPDESKKL